MIIWMVIAGILSGIVAGMGMGGGTLFIPVLTMFFDIQQKLAQSINLIVFVPTAIIALFVHFKHKLVVWRIGLFFILSGVVFSIFGALLATNMSNKVLKIYFGYFLFVIGLWQFIEAFRQIIKKKDSSSGCLVKSELIKFSIRKK